MSVNELWKAVIFKFVCGCFDCIDCNEHFGIKDVPCQNEASLKDMVNFVLQVTELLKENPDVSCKEFVKVLKAAAENI